MCVCVLLLRLDFFLNHFFFYYFRSQRLQQKQLRPRKRHVSPKRNSRPHQQPRITPQENESSQMLQQLPQRELLLKLNVPPSMLPVKPGFFFFLSFFFFLVDFPPCCVPSLSLSSLLLPSQYVFFYPRRLNLLCTVTNNVFVRVCVCVCVCPVKT